jgi:hypothetical protein
LLDFARDAFRHRRLRRRPICGRPEQIWRSWRYEKSAPKSVDAAEQVTQLKRIDE